MADETYRCSLSEKSLKKAVKELNEDAKERLGAVQALREWIEREPWISAPTNTLFLLAFLRVSKFSQLKARERIGNFFFHLNRDVYYLKGCDPIKAEQLDIIKDCSYVFLPGTDKEGRNVILTRPAAIGVDRYTYEQYMKAVIPLFHALMFISEEEQVNGLTYIIDFGGSTMKFLKWMGFDKIKQMADFINKSFPARIKGLNYYNTGPVFEAFMVMIKPLLAPKIRDRIHVHHTMVTVYELFDLSILPEEYLPDDYKGPSAGKLTDIIEKNIKNLLCDPFKLAFLRDLYNGNYYADLTKKSTDAGQAASFRKLNIS